MKLKKIHFYLSDNFIIPFWNSIQKNKVKKVIVSFLLLFTQHAFAQLGLNPSKVKWQQINDDTAQIIFPAGMTVQAQRASNIVHSLFKNDNDLGNKKKKVSVILHNQTTISNGFVSLIPFRSEFYLTPPQASFLGTSSWLDILTIHEYRHVQQLVNARRGVTNLAATLLGRFAWSALHHRAIPRWFMEGDAVYAETAYSKSGRGRLATFDMEYRSLIFDNKIYNYEKAAAGSYKDFVPNHYNLGYYMTTYARKKFGKNVWKEVLIDAGKYEGIFYPFSRNLKKHTGLRTKHLYKATMHELDSTWSKRTTNNQEAKKVRGFTSYTNPVFAENNKLIFEKSSFKKIRSFYKVDSSEKETKLLTPGIQVSSNTSLSYSKGLLTWSELTFDKRWYNKNYSVVRLFDLEKNKKINLTEKTKYFSPSLSSDASKIVVVDIKENMLSTIKVIDAKTGRELMAFDNTESHFYSFPKFLPSDNQIVVVAQKNSENGLVLLDINSKAVSEIVPFSSGLITNPFPSKDHVFFSSAISGTNQIYAVNLTSRKVFLVTNSTLGAFQPAISANSEEIAYSEFSSTGYKLRREKLYPERWTEVDYRSIVNQVNYIETLVSDEEGDFLEKLPDRSFEVKKFKKTSGLINPHSLLINPLGAAKRAEVIFANKFSTLQGSLGYFYNLNEKFGGFYGALTYGGWYPQITLQATTNLNRSKSFPVIIDRVREVEQDTVAGISFSKELEWRENIFSSSIAIPLNLTRGYHLTSLLISVKPSYHSLRSIKSNDEQFSSSESFSSISGKFRFSRLQQRAHQNINPRWGQSLFLEYSTVVNDDDFDGNFLHLRSSLYFPGLFLNHSLQIEFDHRKEDVLNTYTFVNNFFNARGYSVPINDEISRASFNYALPLLYPDLALGSIAFVKRIRANLFFDYSKARFREINFEDLDNESSSSDFGRGKIDQDSDMRSFGAEVFFDIRAMRLIEISPGLRVNYLLDSHLFGDKKISLEFVLASIQL